MKSLREHVPSGVVFGEHLNTLYRLAKEGGFAYPAVNVVSSHSINAALEAAKNCNSPIVIQLSYGGAAFFAGKGIPLAVEEAAVLGGIAAAQYVHQVAKYYDVPVILHTDHASKKLLPWIDGLLEAGEAHFKMHGFPLFSSHMLDLSEQALEENIAICQSYFKHMAQLQMGIEIELGCTGGEEDGVDNSDLDSALLYTRPEEVAFAYTRLKSIDDSFTIAAAFGNVHGVYKPGNVKLTPKILCDSQTYINEHLNTTAKPVDFVFHGGSGSSLTEIHEAISYGVVKMNIDTDTQWASWHGLLRYYQSNKDYLHSQIGNSQGEDLPNKKYYDPRVWMREVEQAMTERLMLAFEQLNCLNRYL